MCTPAAQEKSCPLDVDPGPRHTSLEVTVLRNNLITTTRRGGAALGTCRHWSARFVQLDLSYSSLLGEVVLSRAKKPHAPPSPPSPLTLELAIPRFHAPCEGWECNLLSMFIMAPWVTDIKKFLSTPNALVNFRARTSPFGGFSSTSWSRAHGTASVLIAATGPTNQSSRRILSHGYSILCDTIAVLWHPAAFDAHAADFCGRRNAKDVNKWSGNTQRVQSMVVVVLGTWAKAVEEKAICQVRSDSVVHVERCLSGQNVPVWLCTLKFITVRVR